MHNSKTIIFSAPSVSGKTTLVSHILSIFPNIKFSISASTRDKRGRTETQGKDYYFLSIAEFKAHIDRGDFIEWEEVYEGNFYGTLKSEIDKIWSEGNHVIFDVDVKGGLNLKKHFGEQGLAIFVKVPDLETLSDRLKDRGTENEDSLSRRLYKADFEMSFADQFDEILVNAELTDSFNVAENLVRRFIDEN